MLYWILKPIVTIGLHGYFKKIEVIGKKNLERKRVIFVSNHAGAMIDPLLVAINTKKQLHFIAGAEWFGKGLRSWVFRKQFNMIPVYRPWLKKGEKTKKEMSNDEMFRACYDALAEGKRIVIYPEASSITVPWLREIKTGAARIKLGGDATYPDLDPIDIIPIGVNYTNPHRFQTSVTLKVGNPIAFKPNPEDDEKTQAIRLTEAIRQGMQDCLLHVEDPTMFPLLKQVLKMMTQEVSEKDIKRSESRAESAFKAKKEILKAAEFFLSNESVNVGAIEEKLNTYISRFEGHGFRKFNPHQESPLALIARSFYLIVTLPLFLLGMVINGLPILLAQSLFRRLLLGKVTQEHADGQINPAFAGSLAFLTGFVVFLIWYVLISVIAAYFYTAWIAVPVLLGIALLSGRFFVSWMRTSYRWWQVVKWKTLSSEERNTLLKMRTEALSTLNSYREKYLEGMKRVTSD